MLMSAFPPPRKRGEECQFRRTMVRAEDILMRLTRGMRTSHGTHPLATSPCAAQPVWLPSRGPTHSRSTLRSRNPLMRAAAPFTAAVSEGLSASSRRTWRRTRAGSAPGARRRGPAPR